jgi:hypothetical protein
VVFEKHPFRPGFTARTDFKDHAMKRHSSMIRTILSPSFRFSGLILLAFSKFPFQKILTRCTQSGANFKKFPGSLKANHTESNQIGPIYFEPLTDF